MDCFGGVAAYMIHALVSILPPPRLVITLPIKNHDETSVSNSVSLAGTLDLVMHVTSF
jgi:hypothetical protein